jgi:PAS domain-containing protein
MQNLLINTIPHLLWTAFPDGTCDYFSDRWKAYTGLTMQDSKSWGWGWAIHPDDLQRGVNAWTKALKTGDMYEVEYRLRVTLPIYCNVIESRDMMASIDGCWRGGVRC